MWLESAGGGLRVSLAGKWLAALTGPELDGIDAERRAFADLSWDKRNGDRHTAMTILVCGANPADILDALHGALLTDDELLPRATGSTATTRSATGTKTLCSPSRSRFAHHRVADAARGPHVSPCRR